MQATTEASQVAATKLVRTDLRMAMLLLGVYSTVGWDTPPSVNLSPLSGPLTLLPVPVLDLLSADGFIALKSFSTFIVLPSGESSVVDFPKSFPCILMIVVA